MERAEWIAGAAELGRAHRAWDLALGIAAAAPLAAAAVLVWLAPPLPAAALRVMAVLWSGALLAFFAGVRRGLTFSEAGGARPAELWTMLLLFALAVLALALGSPAVATLGFIAVGLLDARSARRGEAPDYFAVFRPWQMAACALAMADLALHGV